MSIILTWSQAPTPIQVNFGINYRRNFEPSFSNFSITYRAGGKTALQNTYNVFYRFVDEFTFGVNYSANLHDVHANHSIAFTIFQPENEISANVGFKYLPGFTLFEFLTTYLFHDSDLELAINKLASQAFSVQTKLNTVVVDNSLVASTSQADRLVVKATSLSNLANPVTVDVTLLPPIQLSDGEYDQTISESKTIQYSELSITDVATILQLTDSDDNLVSYFSTSQSSDQTPVYKLWYSRYQSANPNGVLYAKLTSDDSSVWSVRVLLNQTEFVITDSLTQLIQMQADSNVDIQFLLNVTSSEEATSVTIQFFVGQPAWFNKSYLGKLVSNQVISLPLMEDAVMTIGAVLYQPLNLSQLLQGYVGENKQL